MTHNYSQKKAVGEPSPALTDAQIKQSPVSSINKHTIVQIVKKIFKNHCGEKRGKTFRPEFRKWATQFLFCLPGELCLQEKIQI